MTTIHQICNAPSAFTLHFVMLDLRSARLLSMEVEIAVIYIGIMY